MASRRGPKLYDSGFREVLVAASYQLDGLAVGSRLIGVPPKAFSGCKFELIKRNQLGGEPS